jgi:N-acetylglucosamine malate deacetylase 1
MKLTPKLPTDLAPLLALGAHPDDIEFGCGGVVAEQAVTGRRIHLVICSQGESATYGDAPRRVAEAKEAARILGATIEFAHLGGDAHFQVTPESIIAMASILRRVKPSVVLAPSLVENQHPDHPRLGRIVMDAARLARFGGVAELQAQAPHAIEQLFYYSITTEAEPRDISPIFIDISAENVMDLWKKTMEAHASQTAARRYVELQITRARLNGLRAGLEYAAALFPADPLVLDSLSQISKSTRQF